MAEHKKIGIMGGTFNPIHFGHLLLAETAFHQFNLDEILIMPTKNPYYKKISNSVTEEDRVGNGRTSVMKIMCIFSFLKKNLTEREQHIL